MTTWQYPEFNYNFGMGGTSKPTVGWFAWEPELIDPKGNSAAAGYVFMAHIFDKLSSEFNFIWLPYGETPAGMQSGVWQGCDIIYIAWRWPFPQLPKYKKRNKLYTQQMRMLMDISHLPKSQRPRVIIHDQDHMCTHTDKILLDEIGAEMYEPSFLPHRYAKTLHYPNPYANKQIQRKHFNPDIIYIGNKYERESQAIRFLSVPSHKHSVRVWGKWKAEDPIDSAIEAMPDVNFAGALNQTKTIKYLNRSASTIHLSKRSYARSGLWAIRWMEAAAAGTLAWIPREFALPADTRNNKYIQKVRVNNGDVIMALWPQMFKDGERTNLCVDIINAQRDLIKKYATDAAWYNALKGTK